MNSKILENMEIDDFLDWYEGEMHSDELPSKKYETADRLRHKDLSFEYGDCRRVAPTIPYCAESAMDFRRMVAEFRKRRNLN